MEEISWLQSRDIVGLKYGKDNARDFIKPFARDILLLESRIAGTAHIEGIEDLESYILTGESVSFYREPDHVDDTNTIAVRTEYGTKIGYVPKKDNVALARLMDAGKLLVGKITAKELSGSWVKIYMNIYLRE